MTQPVLDSQQQQHVHKHHPQQQQKNGASAIGGAQTLPQTADINAYQYQTLQPQQQQQQQHLAPVPSPQEAATLAYLGDTDLIGEGGKFLSSSIKREDSFLTDYDAQFSTAYSSAGAMQVLQYNAVPMATGAGSMATGPHGGMVTMAAISGEGHPTALSDADLLSQMTSGKSHKHNKTVLSLIYYHFIFLTKSVTG
jgi:hypothetical protein